MWGLALDKETRNSASSRLGIHVCISLRLQCKQRVRRRKQVCCMCVWLGNKSGMAGHMVQLMDSVHGRLGGVDTIRPGKKLRDSVMSLWFCLPTVRMNLQSSLRMYFPYTYSLVFPFHLHFPLSSCVAPSMSVPCRFQWWCGVRWAITTFLHHLRTYTCLSCKIVQSGFQLTQDKRPVIESSCANLSHRV